MALSIYHGAVNACMGMPLRLHRRRAQSGCNEMPGSIFEAMIQRGICHYSCPRHHAMQALNESMRWTSYGKTIESWVALPSSSICCCKGVGVREMASQTLPTAVLSPLAQRSSKQRSAVTHLENDPAPITLEDSFKMGVNQLNRTLKSWAHGTFRGLADCWIIFRNSTIFNITKMPEQKRNNVYQGRSGIMFIRAEAE